MGTIKHSCRHLRRWGVIYWTPWTYRLLIGLIRPHHERVEMLDRVAQEIGSLSTLELCCGTGDLATKLNTYRYTGIDQNPIFVRSMRNRHIAVECADIRVGAWPHAQCIVIIDSLYHFIDDIDTLLRRMQQSPYRRIIISEPIRNLTPRVIRPAKRVIAWMTRIENRLFIQRFDEGQLQALFMRYHFKTIVRAGHNMIGVWDRHA